jgi:hypothetical protein
MHPQKQIMTKASERAKQRRLDPASLSQAVWMRPPPPGQRCQLTGLSRTTLIDLGNRRAIIMKRICKPGSSKGIIIINKDSLRAYLDSITNEPIRCVMCGEPRQTQPWIEGEDICAACMKIEIDNARQVAFKLWQRKVKIERLAQRVVQILQRATAKWKRAHKYANECQAHLDRACGSNPLTKQRKKEHTYE